MNTIPKIVYDKLASGGGIFLPEVGSLYIERDPAKFISKKELKPPHNRIVYSCRQNPSLESVVDTLARTEAIPAESAAGIYAQWLEEARGDRGFVEIHGVGVIKNNFFYPSVGLHEKLNPLGSKNIQLRRYKKNSHIWLIAVMAVLAIAAIVLFLVASANRNSHRKAIMERMETVISGSHYEDYPDAVEEDNDMRGTKTGPDDGKEKDKRTVEKEVKAENTAREQKATGLSATTVVNPTYHVVAGVFDTRRNAEKCVREDPLKIGSANYKIYSYKGDRYMVSAFETSDKAAADNRRRELRKYKSDIWVYTKK